MEAAVPMFPLGTVLFPYAFLPLHVFEPRYRALVQRCLAGRPEFGVVLIERGSEVGGGDVRSGVGTVARIVSAAELPDGRYVLGAVGTERFRVRRWLVDDPYPRAEIDVATEPAPSDGDDARRDDVARLLERVAAKRAELGDAAEVEPAGVLDVDPVRASYEAAAAAGLGPLDAQAVLGADSCTERLARVAGMLREQIELLDLRLGRPTS